MENEVFAKLIGEAVSKALAPLYKLAESVSAAKPEEPKVISGYSEEERKVMLAALEAKRQEEEAAIKKEIEDAAMEQQIMAWKAMGDRCFARAYGNNG